jgi:hypothetical protein
MNYVKNYETGMYSWRTCDDYRYNMWSATCRIGQVSYPGLACPQSNGGNSCGCPSGSFLNDIMNNLNSEVRWYSEYTSGDRY